MGGQANTIICDGSALHLHLHSNGPESIGAEPASCNPLDQRAASAVELAAFNTEHPLLGGEPVDVLVAAPEARRNSAMVVTHLCGYHLPSHAFLKLRDGVFVASPELTFARLGYGRSEVQLARIGLDLCGGYYLDMHERAIRERSRFLTTPERLRDFLRSVPRMRGSAKASRALRWVLPNSGSPAESQTFLQLNLPMRYGGFGLPFDALNYDIAAGRYSKLAEQGAYCIDAVNLAHGIGVEYDGADYHLDSSADKRRRNALASFGWQIFPLDKSVLYNPAATERFAHQVAKALGVRLRKPANWERRFAELRRDLNLPA